MREEIAAAVVFLTRMVKKNEDISKDKAEEFSNHLSAVLVEKFKNHWYDDNPLKGQGYRCIRINETHPVDPVLEQAATHSGLKYGDLNLPKELTLWVDPREVCCRFGEAKGSYCTLAEFQNGSMDIKAHKVNLDTVLQKAKELKISEEKKIAAGPRAKQQHNSKNIAKVQRQHVKSISTLKKQPMHARQFLNRGQFHMPHGRPTFSSPFFPPPMYAGDKYHWVRGADLVRA